MSAFSPNFEFADDSPVQKNRKHRRGRAHQSSAKSSFKSTGGHHSSAASSSLSAHSPAGPDRCAASEWESNPNNVSVNSKNKDDNSCAGSLTYSASSSVQSGMSSGGESSNDSSFANIIKLIDSEGEGASEIKAFIAAKSEAADNEGPHPGGGAVAGWMQRVDARSKQAKMEKERMQAQMQMHSAMAASGRGRGKANVSLNYSRDDSDEEGYGDNVLETITGRDEEARRHNITVTTGSRRTTSPREGRSPSPYNSSSPSRHGTVTPPPNTRNKRTSTPPGYASAPPIVRTSSHRSKSSSDGSWDTPTASPPGSNSRPPHARHTVASIGSRRATGKGERGQDVSEAVYTKFWMCGFTDAFNFDNLKKP